MNEKILSLIVTANIHATRLQWAAEKMQSWMPLSAQKLSKFNMEELSIIELLTNRFAKLQDLLGAKLFPAILELTKEPQPPTVFIDILNRLEKIGVLPSMEQWLIFRKTRNGFAHDYPDDSEQNAVLINQAFTQHFALLKVFNHMLNFIDPYLIQVDV